MFDLQYIIVALVLLGAFAYVARMLVRKTRSFSPKSNCGDDCGCSPKSKTPNIAH